VRVEIVEHEAALAAKAADAICEVARAQPECVLGLPTGSTPIATYRELHRREQAGAVDFSRATGFAIDEFAGVATGAPGTNRAFFEQHLGVRLRALHVPDAAANDADAEIRRFAALIDDGGGLDLCVLGIGLNGHIAFNEPGSTRDSRARAVTLDAATREAHAAAFGGLDQTPARGMTLGIADILTARRIIVIAQGAAKAAIVASAIEGPQTAEAPASWLQARDDALWLLDEASASRLRA
jgi:glucosamine-6-phosphate deaminase